MLYFNSTNGYSLILHKYLVPYPPNYLKWQLQLPSVNMISFLCFKPPPRNRRIRFPVFTPRGSAPAALRPQKLELPLRLVDPMIAYAVYNYHQFFPAQFICPHRIVGDSWPPFRPSPHLLLSK